MDELEKRHLLGFVFQDFQLFPHLSVMENLILSPIKTMGMSEADAKKKAVDIIKLVWDSKLMQMPILIPYLVVKSNGLP